MDAKKLKRGTMYYCLVSECWYGDFAIVKAKYISNAGYPYNSDLVFVEQNIDGAIYRFGIDPGKIYPLDKEILSAVWHNERQTRRIIEHDKTFNSKNAKEKIEGWIATLLETDQKALRVRYREAYPDLVKPSGEFLGSKFKIKHWNDLINLYFNYKYPKVKVPKY